MDESRYSDTVALLEMWGGLNDDVRRLALSLIADLVFWQEGIGGR